MSGLILIFAIWCCFAIPIGWGMAKIEQKVNNLPEPRTKSAILFSVFLGPIGWIILAMRSGMKFAGTFNQSQKLQAQMAQQQLQDRQDRQGRQGTGAQAPPG
jgi:hypothetical protein